MAGTVFALAAVIAAVVDALVDAIVEIARLVGPLTFSALPYESSFKL